MATLNRIARIFTHEGAPAKRIDAVAQLERSVMSCLLWEEEFYESGQTIGPAHRRAGEGSPGGRGRAHRGSGEGGHAAAAHSFAARPRTAAHQDGRAAFGGVAEKVFARADDIAEFLALYWKDNKNEPLAKQAKRHVGEAFRRFDEYQLAKYNGGQKAVKLRDAIRITRPKPKDAAQAELWRKLVKGELATPDTWEVELSKGGDKLASWTRLLAEQKLGGLAMLRNLRNMREAGVPVELVRAGSSASRPVGCCRSTSSRLRGTTRSSRRSLRPSSSSASRTRRSSRGTPSSSWTCPGRWTGSCPVGTELTRMDVACSLAMIGREMFDHLRVFTFSNGLVEVPARKGFGLRDAITGSQSHGETELGNAVKGLPACDRLIVITDEQSHDSVPDRTGYMLNVASNKNGVGYGTWLHIDGWSDKVLTYIARYEASEQG